MATTTGGHYDKWASYRCCCGACPECTATTTTCCKCVCLAICVTFTPSDYSCADESVEIDWDDYEQAYIGTIAGHDVKYFFAQEEDEYGELRCYFKLESYTLGNHRWRVGPLADDEITCTALNTAVEVEETYGEDCSGGVVSTYCVDWINPTRCNTCRCLCEEICVYVTRTDAYESAVFSGKLAWDPAQQAYSGTVTHAGGVGEPDETMTVAVPIDAWGAVCGEADYDCDPYDETCAIGLTLGSGEDAIDGEWQKMVACELRNLDDYEWDVTDGDTTYAVTMRCAVCNEECEPAACECDGVPLPATLTATVSFGGRCAVTPGFQLVLDWVEVEGSWLGTTDACGEAAPLTIRVSCSPNSEDMVISITPTSSCDPLNGAVADVASCDPLYLKRTIAIEPGWLSCNCCPPDGLPPSPGTIIIEITL